MTDELLNAVKRHVASMIGQVGTTRVGVVTSVNPADYTAKVMIQPEGVMSGWLPISAMMIGNGWGLVSPPSNGEQVVIAAQEGDAEHGIIIGRLFSNQQLPPKTYADQTQQGTTTNVQPGEIGLVHKSGKFIRLLSDRILINGDLYENGVLHATGNVITDQNVQAKVNISAGADVSDIHGTLDRLRRAYNAHVHPNGGTPVPQDPE